MNKKLRRLMQPSLAVYFAVLFLFCVPLVLLQEYVYAGICADD